MGPSCRTLGPPSNLNMVINYETWRRHFDEDMPHVSFCGTAALHQLQKNRHFLLEHQFPSWITSIDPWPLVYNHGRVAMRVVHQCMVEQRGTDGFPAKKPSQVVASDEALLRPFNDLRCDGTHVHSKTWNAQGGIGGLQVWTWSFSQKVVQGIINLRRKEKMQSLYPDIGVGEALDAEPASSSRTPAQDDGSAQWWHLCRGCKGHYARNSRYHSRIEGECKFPGVEPERVWTCPGCSRKPKERPRGHADHNDIDGECRWATAASRMETGRKGRHPREARLRGSDDPSAGLRGEELVPETDTAPAADPAEADIRDPI